MHTVHHPTDKTTDRPPAALVVSLAEAARAARYRRERDRLAVLEGLPTGRWPL